MLIGAVRETKEVEWKFWQQRNGENPYNIRKNGDVKNKKQNDKQLKIKGKKFQHIPNNNNNDNDNNKCSSSSSNSSEKKIHRNSGTGSDA